MIAKYADGVFCGGGRSRHWKGPRGGGVTGWRLRLQPALCYKAQGGHSQQRSHAAGLRISPSQRAGETENSGRRVSPKVVISIRSLVIFCRLEENIDPSDMAIDIAYNRTLYVDALHREGGEAMTRSGMNLIGTGCPTRSTVVVGSILATLGLLLCLAAPAPAQDTSTIVGTVQDSSGAVIPNVKVTVS